MEIFTTLFAGLGLFFIGIRLIGSNLTQLSSLKMRQMITRAVSRSGSVALFGLMAGSIMQSLNAVTHVLVAMVTAGTLDHRRAFPIISWANIGTSMLVIIAAVNLHSLVMVLIGVTGLAYYLNLDQTARYRNIVGALLGIGMLFLGIDYIKTGSGILRETLWIKEIFLAAGNYPLAGFMIGAAVALVAQSSSTVTVIAMAMASAGLIDFDAGSMIVIGAGLGSAISVWVIAGQLEGSTRQLILFQILLKGTGVALMLLLAISDRVLGAQMVERLLSAAALPPAAQLAAVYVALQITSDLGMRAVRRPAERFLERYAPPSDREILGRPRYIHEAALAEPETALMLVEMEQQRLLSSLPHYLAPLRIEEEPEVVTVRSRYVAESNVTQQCDQFLTEILDHHSSRAVLEQAMILRDRNELLSSLQETLLAFSATTRETESADAIRLSIAGVVESTHMMLETLVDVCREPDAQDLEMLRILTHDRSEMMDNLRRQMLGSSQDMALQRAVFSATSLFERCIWLLRRFVLLLDERKSA